MNYATLFKTIQGYLENDFPSFVGVDSSGSGTATLTAKQQIDTFIQQAEQRIYNSVQFPRFRKTQEGVTGIYSVSPDTAMYLNCPSDFLAPYSFIVISTTGSYEFLLNKDVEYIRAAYPNPTTTGIPKYYAIFGPTMTSGVITTDTSFILAPTPDQAYAVQLNYYAYPESIVTASTSWLGDNFDTVLLYGALQEAYTFIKAEPDMLGRIDSQYKEALALAKRLADGLERQDAYRSGQARYPVA